MKLLLRVDEAAAACSISKSACYSAIAAGLLPAIRVGHAIRVPVAALEAWINEQAAASVNGSDDQQVASAQVASRPERRRA